jgi:aspartate/methionine/tyrosine aminotransferase
MRPYSKYLEEIKSESINARYNLGGSTPPARTDWKRKTFEISQEESWKSPYLESVKMKLADMAGVSVKQVAICPGGSQAAFQTLAAITRPGDTILLETPVYEPFMAAAKFLSLKVRHFKRSGDFEKEIEEIRTKARGCKVALISNPHCPSGHLYSSVQLKKISHIIKLVVDEVFLPIFTGGKITLTDGRGMVSLGGLSKSIGLSSLRIGWVIADSKTARDIPLVGYNLHIDMPTAPLQIADQCLDHWSELLEDNLKLADENRKIVLEFDAKNPGLIPIRPSSGHFFTMKIPKNFKSDRGFANALLKKSVWVRPGEDFQMKGFVRVGLLIPSSDFAEAFKRIDSFYE